MPTVTVVRDRMFSELGRSYTDEEFDELCFEYGLELDAVVEEKLTFGSRARTGVVEDEEIETTVYKLDVPANRYDLLCVEGVAKALRVFKGIDPQPPQFHLTEPQITMKVLPETKHVREFVVCAVLRNIELNPDRYRSLMELQEKLHQNICRRRTLVAIGTHDLDKIRAPFTYEALPPAEISFTPLSKQKKYTAPELMEMYETDIQLKKYLPIIRDEPRYPVIYDADRIVCSMPPIINGDHSKVTLDTRNMLIECTATDRTKAKVVLNTIVAMFSGYCEDAYSVEPVRVEYLDEHGAVDRMEITPVLDSTEITTTVDYLRKAVGVELSAEQITELLRKMMLTVESNTTEGTLTVHTPIVRSDIIHACDIAEDVAVAYGFDNIEEKIPESFTIGKAQPLNQLSDLVRREGLAQQGYVEVLTWVTVSHAENFDMLQRIDDGTRAVKIANPKTLEFQECRVDLLPGVLKTLRENRNMRLPIRLFELGDCVRLEATAEVGAVNERRLCAVYCGTAAGFEVVKALLDHVMQMLNVRPGDGVDRNTFRLDEEACTDDALFPGRRANIIVNNQSVGVIGWIHPNVLEKFSLSNPCSALEILIEPFL